MSRSPSNAPVSAESGDPLRPSDYADSPRTRDLPPAPGPDGDITVGLGVSGWVRWGWRQLTSMRTALVLLLLLAVAAIPGSLVPQRSADPNGVTQYYDDNPELAGTLDSFGMFDVYTSPWFSAIYLLLFISLIGCVLPRTKHHYKALRARPPRTPMRLQRLGAYHREEIPAPAGTDEPEAAESVIQLAHDQLRKGGYRVERYDTGTTVSVSAERGYLRESGNLVFHVSLLGVLLAVGIGGGFTYTGQAVIIEGRTFTNTLLDHTSFNPGRFVDTEALVPYSLDLERFTVSYVPPGQAGAGQAGDFVAHLTTRFPGEDPAPSEVRVNHPIEMGGDRIYLMGNGYAPTLTIKDEDSEIVYSEPVPFLPQDSFMTSLGVVKIPDGMPQQLGLVGFFYPTGQALPSGAMTSVYGDLEYPVLTLDVYTGDLGINDGTPRSVYALDTSGMTKLTGRDTEVPSIELMPGQSAELPDGLGTITFENEAPAGAADYDGSVKRFVSLSIHRDAGTTWVLIFSITAMLGLMAALFVPRRRIWVRAVPGDATVSIEYAGLARGEDPGLAQAVTAFAARHTAALGQGPR